jgi:hypothetical protein
MFSVIIPDDDDNDDDDDDDGKVFTFYGLVNFSIYLYFFRDYSLYSRSNQNFKSYKKDQIILIYYI